MVLGLFILLGKHSFKVSCKQAGVLVVLGLLYSASSLLLFEAYNYIASGLATTLVFLYPVLVGGVAELSFSLNFRPECGPVCRTEKNQQKPQLSQAEAFLCP